MNRRSFLASLAASASALVLPYEPKRVYSFMAGRLWAEPLDVDGTIVRVGQVLENTSCPVDRMLVTHIEWYRGQGCWRAYRKFTDSLGQLRETGGAINLDRYWRVVGGPTS